MTEFWNKPAEKSGKVLAAFLEGLPLVFYVPSHRGPNTFRCVQKVSLKYLKAVPVPLTGSGNRLNAISRCTVLAVWMSMPHVATVWVRFQHPPTQLNLRVADEEVFE
jgi:hypothetical protein